MFQKLKNMIENLFKIGKVITVDDSGNYQYARVFFLGKTQQVLSAKPYGMISNPPPGSMSLLWNNGGKESDIVAILDDPINRPKGLLPGEAGISNFLTGNTLILSSQGTLEAITSVLNVSGDINALTNITAVNITGTGIIQAPVIIVGALNLGTHVHDNGTGTGTPTGTPVGP